MAGVYWRRTGDAADFGRCDFVGGRCSGKEGVSGRRGFDDLADRSACAASAIRTRDRGSSIYFESGLPPGGGQGVGISDSVSLSLFAERAESVYGRAEYQRGPRGAGIDSGDENDRDDGGDGRPGGGVGFGARGGAAGDLHGLSRRGENALADAGGSTIRESG